LSKRVGGVVPGVVVCGPFLDSPRAEPEVPFIQEVSSVYTSPFLETNELKMALRARKVSGAFEKRTPGLYSVFCISWVGALIRAV